MERYRPISTSEYSSYLNKSFDELVEIDKENIAQSLLDPNATQHYSPEMIRLLISKKVGDNQVTDNLFVQLEQLGKNINSKETALEYIAGVNNLRNLGNPKNPLRQQTQPPMRQTPRQPTTRIDATNETKAPTQTTQQTSDDKMGIIVLLIIIIFILMLPILLIYGIYKLGRKIITSLAKTNI